MFSISKNPQASMDEVLAKAEKYINGEEALLSKRGSSSTRKKKAGMRKREIEFLRVRESEKDLREETRKTEGDPQREGETSGIA